MHIKKIHGSHFIDRNVECELQRETKTYGGLNTRPEFYTKMEWKEYSGFD